LQATLQAMTGVRNERLFQGVAARCVGLLAVAMMIQLTGCASSLPVGLQQDGSYILDKNEWSMDCDRLYKAAWGHIQLMKQFPARAKAERESTPPTAMLAFGRMFGSKEQGIATFQEYDRKRAHVDALHRAMVVKGCARIDPERELAETDAAMAEMRNP
jgi:hypothetical protein